MADSAMMDYTETEIHFYGYEPFDPKVPVYIQSVGSMDGSNALQPFEYTGWMDEMMSWHETCFIHSGLNPVRLCEVWGPDAIELMHIFSSNCLDEDRFPIGRGKHFCVCREDGKVVFEDMIVRGLNGHYYMPTATWFVQKTYDDAVAAGKTFDVNIRDTGEEYAIIQTGGPRSLEIIENACEQDIHDVKFMDFVRVHIAGHECRVLRMGMCGSLAYEVWCKTEDFLDIYNRIWEIGQDYGMKKVGRHAYWNMHTEGGMLDGGIHVPMAGFGMDDYQCLGSLEGGVEERLALPTEMGWGNCCVCNHDFTGREVVEREKKNPTRTICTLVWNLEDILDVYRSQFEDEVPYKYMEFAHENEIYFLQNGHFTVIDKVLDENGEFIGKSMGRMYSPYYKKMISVCSIATDYNVVGKEVTVVWGEPGTRQKNIRATVEQFPIMDESERNNARGVEDVPRYVKK